MSNPRSCNECNAPWQSCETFSTVISYNGQLYEVPAIICEPTTAFYVTQSVLAAAFVVWGIYSVWVYFKKEDLVSGIISKCAIPADKLLKDQGYGEEAIKELKSPIFKLKLNYLEGYL
jgi:hypothetical protein